MAARPAACHLVVLGCAQHMVRHVVSEVDVTIDQTRGAVPRPRSPIDVVSNVAPTSRCRLPTRRSYQVPKEVGKVGTESPTFIQPVAGRKDGIQAMFAKQAASLSSQQSKGAKRKRSASPEAPSPTMQVKKEPSDDGTKPPANKLNTWEDDSQIEYIDGPSSADKVRRSVQLYVRRPRAPFARSRTRRLSKTRMPYLHYHPRRKR